MLITKRIYKRNTSLEAQVSSIPSGTFLRERFSSNTAKKLASAALQFGKTAAKILK